MKTATAVVLCAAIALCTLALGAQRTISGATRSPISVAAVGSPRFHTVYIRLGSKNDEGLLYEPTSHRFRSRIALLFSHTDGNTFNYPIAKQMAIRGYRILMVNHHGPEVGLWAYAPGISWGIRYLRSLRGVRRVVIVGHSGGAPLMAFYANVAAHGPAACAGAQKLYPCPASGLIGLARPDGVILLDPPLGAFHAMSSIDPAVRGNNPKSRIPALDMFAAANGFNAATGAARYSAAFARQFYAAQAARNARILDRALARLHAIEHGESHFRDDEPLVVPGMGMYAAGARLYDPDPFAFLSHTRTPHLLLEPDGRTAQEIVWSIRPPLGAYVHDLDTLNVMTQETTVRRFLANYAIRTTSRYAITADDILGVDWNSAATSTPSNAEGISVPTLVMVMTCHYFVVSGEIVYDHLATDDKTYAAVQGATHMFTPCGREYGDTVKTTFDFVNAWLSKPGRF